MVQVTKNYRMKIMKIMYIINIKVLLLLFVSLSVEAQVNTDSISSPNIMVAMAKGSSQSIQLNWYPSDPDFWKAQMAQGYNIQRQEIDVSGNAIGASSTIASNVLPKDAYWFEANKNVLDGLMEPIGALMYDTTFVFPKNDELDEASMKFNFIVYETTLYEEIAEAVGLGYEDKSVVEGKSYRYTIRAIGSNLEASLDVEASPYKISQVPLNSPVEFRFPDGKSFSQMHYAANPPVIETIQVIAKAYGDSIILRWGPSTAKLWAQAIEDGYQIYRGKGIEQPELIKEVFPWPEEKITADISQDSMALVAATMLYNTEANQVSDDDNFLEASMLFENRYGFSLFAAEQSGLAADILGLRFVDKEVEKDSVYTYFVRTPSVESSLLWGRALVINEVVPIPLPSGFKLLSGDKMVSLVWDKLENEREFSAYQLERSEDQINYKPLHDAPLVFGDDPRLKFSIFSFTDSLGVNDKTYYYRLKGSNSFSEWSDYTYVSGAAVDLTPPSPVKITDAIFIDSSNQFVITWEEPMSQTEDFANYQVLLSQSPEGDYSAVSSFLEKNTTSYTLDMGDADLDRGFFFKIQSQDLKGNVNFSSDQMVIVPDRFAPKAPTDLIGTIDSTGLVRVAWEHSQSKDVTGYWLYWAHKPTDEMTLANDDLLTENAYSFKVADVTLNKKIYFCVRAEDDSYNKGFASEVIEVNRPDKVAPVSPILSIVRSEEETLVIEWKKSISEDAIGQILYKRIAMEGLGDPSWDIVDTLHADQMQYIDKGVRIDQHYEYAIKTYDNANNLSDFSNKITAKIPFPNDEVYVDKLKIKTDQKNKVNKLSWEYNALNDQIANVSFEFDIYRSTGSRPLTLLKTVASDQFTFKDTGIVEQVLYNYAIRVRFINGWNGKLSEVKSVIAK